MKSLFKIVREFQEGVPGKDPFLPLTTTPTTTTMEGGGNLMKCPHCKYEYKARAKKPKRCPLCQKWINKPKIEKGKGG